MFRRVALGVVIAGTALLGSIVAERYQPANAASQLVVTSPGDAGGTLCPSDDACTLRAAIEAANADASGGLFTITFDPLVFPPDAPATITVGLTPLPPITRTGTLIDASSAGVRLRHDNASLSGSANGLVLAGDDAALWGLDVAGFPASCVVVEGLRAAIGGDRTIGRGNRFSDCSTGLAIYGADALVLGNTLLRAGAGDTGAAFDIAIEIAAPGARIGPEQANEQQGNYMGDANEGLVVVGSESSPVSGVSIENNVIGRSAAGTPGAVSTGVLLERWSSGTSVRDNVIANAARGVSVAVPGQGPPIVANRISGNTFNAIDLMSIDLGGDGIASPNDVGDTDSGPNTLLNHPVITRATQSRIEGTTCAACRVEVYASVRLPGGVVDYGSTPLPAGVVTADASGSFVLDSPPVSPGEWVTAIAIDASGNTSEFGPSARVGAGAVQCGNVQLTAGWNHIAYFGPQTVILGDTFSADPSGSVTAVYRAVDGTLNYERWFSDTTVGRTLTLVEPGESYWMFSTGPVSLAGGFSVSFPIPVALEAGWNDFVYVGASADVIDALAGIDGQYKDLYWFDTEQGRFLRYGDPGIPSWAREFGLLAACSTYQVFMLESATLVPLQP